MNTKRIIIGSLLLIVLIGFGILAWKITSGARAPIRASAPDYWPTEGWQINTPEQQGIDSDKLADMLLAIREENIQVHSMILIRNGYELLDATFYPYDGQTVHDMASVTKSVMTSLIGIAADQGKLNLDDKLVSFFPDLSIANLDQRKETITVRHLASMSSGLDCTAEGDEKTLKEMQASPDYVQFVLDRKTISLPGEQFIYCSPALHLLSPILQQATGMTALDFARQFLFEPLGIHDSMWEKDPQGYYDGWGDLSLLPDDMAKIGYLFLQNGQWDGKQIVSRQWVEEASKEQIAIPGGEGYGYGWWMDPAVESGYRADGRGGQYIFILPEWDMVVVTNGGGFEMDDIAPMLLASFSDFEKPLPANPEGVAKLEQAVTDVAQPPSTVAVNPFPEVAGLISGRTYIFQPNPSTVESIAIVFNESAEATISYRAGGSPLVSHIVGLDGVYRFSAGPDGRSLGYRGAWMDAQTFFLEYDGIANNDHSLFQFRFEGDQVKVKVQETSHDVGVEFVGQQQRP